MQSSIIYKCVLKPPRSSTSHQTSHSLWHKNVFGESCHVFINPKIIAPGQAFLSGVQKPIRKLDGSHFWHKTSNEARDLQPWFSGINGINSSWCILGRMRHTYSSSTLEGRGGTFTQDTHLEIWQTPLDRHACTCCHLNEIEDHIFGYYALNMTI